MFWKSRRMKQTHICLVFHMLVLLYEDQQFPIWSLGTPRGLQNYSKGSVNSFLLPLPPVLLHSCLSVRKRGQRCFKQCLCCCPSWVCRRNGNWHRERKEEPERQPQGVAQRQALQWESIEAPFSPIWGLALGEPPPLEKTHFKREEGIFRVKEFGNHWCSEQRIGGFSSVPYPSLKGDFCILRIDENNSDHLKTKYALSRTL